MPHRYDVLLVIAIVAATSYFVVPRDTVAPALIAMLKGSGVGFLALWAFLRTHDTDGRLIALALAFGAAGDALIEVAGLVAGAVAFLAGHIVAVWLYLTKRRAALGFALPIALTIAVMAWLLPANRGMAMAVTLYALALGAMTGTALTSRYPRALVGFGALLFAASDLLLFARMGPLRYSAMPDMLIWPAYFTGQLLIALGVVQSETAVEAP